MKKIALTLLLLNICFLVSAQNLKKNDSIVNVGEGLQLVYKKSKVAVYHGENRFQKPSKNLFIADEIHDVVFELDLKEKEVYGLTTFNDKVKKVLLAQGLHAEIDSMKLADLKPEWKNKLHFFIEQISVQIKDELVYYHFHDHSPSKPIENVYHSGLYSIEYEDYIFQSKTQPLFNIADRYFTTLIGEQDTCFQQLRWINGNIDIENECIRALQPKELKEILSVDEVLPTFTEGYFYTIKNKKWGLIYLNIENNLFTYEEGEEYSFSEHHINFDFKEIVPNKNDFIYHSVLWNQYVIFKDGNMNWVGYLPYEDKEFRVSVNNQFSTYTTNYEIFHIDVDGAVKEVQEDTLLFDFMSVMNGGFGVTKINDSLFIINDYMEDEEIIVYDPETGYEMYDENGYPEMKTIVGLKSSGVYDIKNHQWVLDQGYHYIDYYGGSIMSALNSSENEKPAKRYYDLKGNEVKLDLSSKTGEYDFYNKAFSSKKEDVERANSDYFNNRHFPDTIGSPNELLFYDGVSYRFVPIDAYFISNKVPEEKRYDFIQNSIVSKTLDKMNYQFVISNDTPYFLMNCQDVQSTIRIKNEDFELAVEDFLGEAYSSFQFFVTITYGDTTEYYELNKFYNLESTDQSTYKNPVADLSESFRVQKKNNLLILNSTDYIEEISWGDPDYFWDDDYRKEKSWEIEGSSIWSKNEKGIWKQESGNYAQIMPTPFGFIARTGSYKNSWMDPSQGELNKDQHSSTFDLLDTTGNTIRLFEMKITDCNVFEEDEYYMLRLDNDTKWKLIDRNARLLHEDSFDYYERAGDVIYGIDRELYDIDEFGYEKYDEEGNPILLQKARKVKLN